MDYMVADGTGPDMVQRLWHHCVGVGRQPGAQGQSSRPARRLVLKW
jgi:hypothetical protein